MHIQTKTVHAGYGASGPEQPVVSPIQPGTIFTHPATGFDSRAGSYGYARYGNPNRSELEQMLASLENGAICSAFSSGMASITAVFQVLNPGDHVVVCDDVYHGTRAVLNDIMGRWGLEFTYVDVTDPQNVAHAIRPETKLIWLETPSNPRLLICDIEAICAISASVNASRSKTLQKEGGSFGATDGGGASNSSRIAADSSGAGADAGLNGGVNGIADSGDATDAGTDQSPENTQNPSPSAPNKIRVCVDNTWGTPILQNPLNLGADLVMHSCTKYIGGHSDVLAGAIIAKEHDDFMESIRTIQKQTGAVVSPFDSWMLVRSLKTLVARMRMHCENAKLIAAFLQNHPKVEEVYYPGLAHSPGHEIAKRQMSDFGGMVSALFKGDRDQILKAIGEAKLFKVATSLGGVESLWEHRQSSEGPTSKTPPNLVRMSIGIEHPDDLISDIEQVLAKL